MQGPCDSQTAIVPHASIDRKELYAIVKEHMERIEMLKPELEALNSNNEHGTLTVNPNNLSERIFVTHLNHEQSQYPCKDPEFSIFGRLPALLRNTHMP